MFLTTLDRTQLKCIVKGQNDVISVFNLHISLSLSNKKLKIRNYAYVNGSQLSSTVKIEMWLYYTPSIIIDLSLSIRILWGDISDDVVIIRFIFSFNKYPYLGKLFNPQTWMSLCSKNATCFIFFLMFIYLLVFFFSLQKQIIGVKFI